MKVFYANNNYAKYRIEGANYLMAIMGASFYILMTIALLAMISFVVLPDFYKWSLNYKANSTIFALLYIVISFALLRIGVSESEIKENNFTKEYVDKVINYLIAYNISTIILIGILSLKFLPR